MQADGDVILSWRTALAGLCVRHPDLAARPYWRVDDAGYLHVGCGAVHDTRTGQVRNLPICSVRLTYFPGDTLVRQWFAAAWAGYLQHEALELVTFEGQPPLNAHEEPYESNPYNRGLRDGFPAVLTPESLERALMVVMDSDAARSLTEV